MPDNINPIINPLTLKAYEKKQTLVTSGINVSDTFKQKMLVGNVEKQKINQTFLNDSSNIFSTNSIPGVVGNAALGMANSAYKSVVAIPQLLSELETSADLAGHNIEQVDMDSYHRLNEVSGQVQTLNDQMGASTNLLEQRALQAKINGIKSNLSSEDMTFLKGDNTTQSKYSVIKDYYSDTERSRSLSKASKYFDKYVDSSKVEIAAEEFGIDFDESAPQIMAGLDKISTGDTLAGLGEAISGALSLSADTVGTVIKNPEAVVQIMAESVPEIYMAAKSLVSATLLAGGRSVSANMEDWAKEHNRLPLGDERTKVLLWSAAEAITATMGDKVLASGGSLKRAITGQPVKSATKTTALNAIPKSAAFIGKTGGQEYIQEGTEQAISQMAVKGETDPREIHVAGSLGFGAGAGTSGVTGAVSKVASKVVESLDNIPIPEATVKTDDITEDTVNEAVNLNTATPNNMATGIVNATTILKNDTVNADIKAKAAVAGISLFNKLNIQREALVEEFAKLDENDQEAIAIAKAEINSLDQQIAVTEPYVNQLYAYAESEQFGDDTPQEVHAKLKDTDIATLVQDPSNFIPNESGIQSKEELNKIVDVVLKQVAIGSDSANSGLLRTLAENSNIDLTPNQRLAFNAHAEYIDLAKELDAVSQEVANGVPGKFTGLRTYHKMITSAILSGDVAGAKAIATRLDTFVDQRNKKSDDVTQAFDLGGEVYFPQYRRLDGKPLVIGDHSINLVQAIQNEAKLARDIQASINTLLAPAPTKQTQPVVEPEPATNTKAEPVVEPTVRTPTPEPEIKVDQETLLKAAVNAFEANNNTLKGLTGEVSQTLIKAVQEQLETTNTPTDSDIQNYINPVKKTVPNTSEAKSGTKGDVFVDGHLLDIADILQAYKQHSEEAFRNDNDPTLPIPQLNDLLQRLVKNTAQERSVRVIAKKLMQWLKDTPIDVVLTDTAGTVENAGYYTEDGTIYLKTNYGETVQTLLHEATHVATIKLLDTPIAERTSSQNKLVAEIETLMKVVQASDVYKQNKDKSLNSYAFQDIKEFVAVGFTNPEFQKILKQIEYKKTTIFSSFVSTLRKLLQIPVQYETALDQIMVLTERLGDAQASSKQAPRLLDSLIDAKLPTEEEALNAENAKLERRRLSAIKKGNSTTSVDALIGNNIQNAANAEFISTNQVKKGFTETTENNLLEQGGFFKSLIPMSNADRMNALSEKLGRTITPQEFTLVQNYFGYRKTFLSKFEAAKTSLKKADQGIGGKQSRYTDPIRYFADEEGNLPDEIGEALALASYQWLYTRGVESLFNDSMAISAILGLSDSSSISEAAWELADIGMRQNGVITTIGQSILNMLGLRAKTKNGTSADMIDKVNIALGTYALGVMKDIDAVTAVTTTKKILNNLAGKPTLTEEDGLVVFVKVNEVKTEVIREAADGTNDIISDLALSEPTKFLAEIGEKTVKVSKTMKNSDGQTVTVRIQKAVQKNADIPWKIIKDADFITTLFSIEGFKKIMGYVEDLNTVQAGRLKTVIGKNRTIEQDWYNYQNFKARMEEDLEANFFFNIEIGSNLRQFLQGSDINPQRSKFHRFHIQQEGVEATTSLTDADAMTEFKLGVAQAMGIKTDNQSDASSLNELADLIKTPAIKQSINAMVQILNGNTTQEAQDAVIAGIHAGGEVYHSMLGLIGYARYVDAINTGAVEFTHNIIYETDGKTNGPFINFIQAGLTAMTPVQLGKMMQGGLFFNGNVDYGVWKESNPELHRDMYESTNDTAVIEFNNLIPTATDNNKAIVPLFQLYMAQLGRKLTKTSVTVTNYGSSDLGIQRKVFRDFEIYLYDAIQTAIDTPTNFKELFPKEAAFLAEFNKIIPLPRRRVGLLKFELKPNSRSALEEASNTMLAGPIIIGINKDFFTQRENSDNTLIMSNAMFAMLKPQWDKAIADRRTQLIESGAISSYQGMTKADYNKIKADLIRSMPIFQTYFNPGKGTNEQLSHGIYTGESNAVDLYATQTIGNNRYVGNAGTAHSLDTLNASGSLYVSGGRTNTAHAFEPSVGSSGRSIAAGQTIGNGDASTMILTAESSLPFFNVFDAGIFGIGHVNEQSKNLNTNLKEIMSEYDMLAEQQKTFDRNMFEFAKFIKGNELTVDQIAELNSALFPKGDRTQQQYLAFIRTLTQQDAVDALLAFNTKLKTVANTHTKAKNLALKKNNYALGQFVKNGTAAINGDYEVNPSIKISDIEIQEGSDLDASLASAEVISEPATVQDTVPVNPDLVGVTTVAEVITIVEGSTNPYPKYLLKSLKPLLGDIELILIPDYATAVAEGTENDRGQFRVKDGKKQLVLNVGGPNFYNGLNVETIIHELIHAALYPLTSGAVKLTVKQTKALKQLEQLFNYIKTNNLISNVAAMESLDEFLSWGLINRSTMAELHHIKALPPSITGRITQFVKLIRNFLFTNPNALGNITGLDTLIKYFNDLAKSDEANASLQDTTLRQRVSDAVQSYSSLDIFDYLRSHSTIQATEAHDLHLEGVLTDITTKILDPISTQAKTFAQAFQEEQELIDPDGLALPNSLISLGFQMSDQEKYVYQLLSVALDEGIQDFNQSKAELEAIFKYSATKLSATDFMRTENLVEGTPEYNTELAYGQRRYNAIFAPIQHSRISQRANEFTEDSRAVFGSTYLRNFIVLASVNSQFRTKLNSIGHVPTVSKIKWEGSIVGYISQIVTQLIGKLSGYIQQDNRLSKISDRVDNLTLGISQVTKNNKGKIEQAVYNAAGFISKTAMLPITLVKAGLVKTLQSDAFVNSKLVTIRAAGLVGEAVLNTTRGQQLRAGVEIAQHQINTGKLGFIAEYINEMKGTTSDNSKLHAIKQFANKEIDQAYAEIKLSVSDATRSLFVTAPTVVQETAINKAMLKTDLVSLLENGYSVEAVQELLQNPTVLKTEITRIQNLLKGAARNEGIYNFYQRSTAGLGLYMATGNINEIYQLLNTLTIAEVNIPGQTKLSKHEVDKVLPLIEQLATLEALGFTANSHKTIMATMIQTEPEAVQFMFESHKIAKEDALTRTFNNAERLVIKGYTKEIINHYKDIKVVTGSEGDILLRSGYQEIAKLNKDPNDPMPTDIYMYVSENGGNAPLVQGAMANMTKGTKGTSLTDLSIGRQSNFAIQLDTQTLTNAKQAGIQEMFLPKTGPIDTTVNYMVPIINAKGNVAGYRYMMNEITKDEILEKDNDGIEGLASLHAGTNIKVNSLEVNRQLMELLAETYREDAAKGNLSNYVKIGPNVDSKLDQDLWRRIPDEAKELAKTLFGGEFIYVRNDLYTNAFGYREFSLADASKVDRDTPKWINWLYDNVLRTVLGETAGAKISKAERITAEIVKELKDIVVIRSGIVLAANMVSNTVQLIALHGVPAKDAVQNQYKAFIAAKQFKANQAELARLRLLVPVSTGLTLRNMMSNIIKLEEQQATNPVANLISEGLLQTIVEDVDTTATRYTYKEGLVSKLSNAVEYLNPVLRDIAKEALLTRDTKGYGIAQLTTQLSDFAARYALYEQQTKNEGISGRDSIINVNNAFINYDLLTGRGLHYLNKYGASWFFKYWTRIQRVILDVAKNHPERLLMLGLGEFATGIDVADPTDAFILRSSPTSRFGFADKMMGAFGTHPLINML